MFKIIKRLLIFFVAAFIFLSASVYLILNEPFIQNRLLKYVNSHYLAKNGLKLDLNDISYNLLFRTLEIGNLKLTSLESSQSTEPLLSTDSFEVKFNFIGSYIKNHLVLDKFEASGLKLNLKYDESGDLVLPKQLQSTELVSEDPEQFMLLDKYFFYLPAKMTLKNSVLSLGTVGEENYQIIAIKKLIAAKKRQIYSRTKWLQVSAELNPSDLKFTELKDSILINRLNLIGKLYTNGKFLTSKLEANTNLIEFNGASNGQLRTPIKFTSYKLEVINGVVQNQNLFNLFGLQANGNLNFNGDIEFSTVVKPPKVLGHIDWQNFEIVNLNLFSGSGDILLEDKTLYYNNTKIQTQGGGSLALSGKYELFDEFYFENQLKGSNVGLKELLNSIGAKQDIFDGIFNTEAVKINGYFQKTITSQNTSSLNIDITGDVFVAKLSVLPVEQNSEKSLPQLYLNLSTNINNSGISFDNTVAHLNSQNSSQTLKISNSLLRTQPTPNFKMNVSGEKLDLDFLEYFISKKSTGTLNFDGVLTYNDANPGLKFIANLNAHNGSVDRIPFEKAKGQFGLYNDYLDLTNLYIDTKIPILHTKTQNLKAKDKNSYINIEYFSFRFKDKYAKILIDAKGNIAYIVQSIQDSLPNFITQLDGHIDSLALSMTGFFDRFDTWTLNVKSTIKPLLTPRGRVDNLNINLKCVNSICSDSKVLFTNFHTERDGTRIQNSSALVLLSSLSEKNSAFSFQIQNVPASFIDFSKLDMDGRIYSMGEIQGTWKKPYGNVDLTIDKFEMNNRDFGQVKAIFSSNSPEIATLQVTAFTGQFRLSLDIPLTEEIQNSRLKANLFNFDIGYLFDDVDKDSTTLYSRFNAEFTATGPWNPSFKDELSIFKNWTGTGTIQTSEFQYYNTNLQISTPSPIQYANDIFDFKKILIESKFGESTLSGNYNLKTSEMSLHSALAIDLDPLSKEFYIISDSEGKIAGNFNVNGTIKKPIFSGEISIKGKRLSLLSDEPPFTNLDGYVLFRDSVIEIQKLTANKGLGTVSLTGSFDFKNFADSDSFYPETNLHLITKNAPFELSVPIFRSINLQATSDLILSGQKPPFSIAGRINLQKLNIFRDLNCSEIFGEYQNLPKTDPKLAGTPFANLRINLQAVNSMSLQSNCLRGNFSTTDNMYIVGDTNLPLLDGGIVTDNAIFNILKARFNIKKANFNFSDTHGYDPIVNIAMDARVASYTIFWDVNGRLSTAKLNLTSQPQYLPNGDSVNQGSILFMITTGRIPTEDSLNTLLATSSSVYAYFGANNSFSNVVDQTLSTVTGGLFDTLTFQPNAQNGEIAIRVIASKYFSQRLNFGMSFEGGQSLSTSTAFVYYLLNRNVGFTGAFSSSNEASQTGSVINELSGGLRFNFGSN